MKAIRMMGLILMMILALGLGMPALNGCGGGSSSGGAPPAEEIDETGEDTSEDTTHEQEYDTEPEDPEGEVEEEEEPESELPDPMDLDPGDYLFVSEEVSKDSCFSHEFDTAFEGVELLVFYIDESLVTEPGAAFNSPDIPLPLSDYSNPTYGVTFNDVVITGIKFENEDNEKLVLSANKIDDHKLVQEYGCTMDFTISGEFSPIDSQTIDGYLQVTVSDPKGCQALAAYNPIFLGYGSCLTKIDVSGELL